MREMSDAAGGEREADTVPGPLRKPIHFFIFFSQTSRSGLSEKLAAGRALVKIIANIH